MVYCSGRGGIGKGILERILVFKLSIVEPTDSNNSQSLTPPVANTLLKNDGADKETRGRISRLPVPQSQPASFSVINAHLPISPRLAKTISPLCNSDRKSTRLNSSHGY